VDNAFSDVLARFEHKLRNVFSTAQISDLPAADDSLLLVVVNNVRLRLTSGRKRLRLFVVFVKNANQRFAARRRLATARRRQQRQTPS